MSREVTSKIELSSIIFSQKPFHFLGHMIQHERRYGIERFRQKHQCDLELTVQHGPRQLKVSLLLLELA